jgi:hypothetical protein
VTLERSKKTFVFEAMMGTKTNIMCAKNVNVSIGENLI